MDATPHATPSAVTDPVCGMTVDPATAKRRAEHVGRTYFFCSAGCREKFEREPEWYLAPKAEAGDSCCHTPSAASSPPAEVPEGTRWTCPMHPEIVRDRPGSCPICG